MTTTVVKFIDGFDHYATADILKKWESASASNCTIGAGGRNGTNCFRAPQSNLNYLARGMASTVDCVLGFAIMATGTATWSNGQPLCYLIPSGVAINSWNLRLMVNGTNGLQLSVAGGAISSVASGVLGSPGSWNHIELKAHSATGTGGSASVRVNGVEVLTWSGINTAPNGADFGMMEIHTHGLGGTSINIDDVFQGDGTTYLGDCRVDTLFPNGAGSNTDFTPSTGANYTCVDEAVLSTSDYVTSVTPGHVDTYAFGNLVSASGAILGVAVTGALERTGYGARSIALACVSGVTTSVGASKNPGSGAYTYYQEMYALDPNGSVAWTSTSVNAAEFGVKITA